MKKIKKNLVEDYQAFLDVLIQAVRLGLELDTAEDAQIKKTDGELWVWAFAYKIVDENGYGQGHTLLNTYTKTQATEIARLIDQAIFDSNTKRITVIEHNMEHWDLEKLKKYIQIRKQEISKQKL